MFASYADDPDRYSAIQDYGEREPFSNTDQFSEPLLCDDQELRDAIEQLKRSTVATEKQSTLLRTQQEALASLVKGNIQNDKSRAAVDPTHYRAWTTESEKMAYTVSLHELASRRMLIAHRLMK